MSLNEINDWYVGGFIIVGIVIAFLGPILLPAIPPIRRWLCLEKGCKRLVVKRAALSIIALIAVVLVSFALCILAGLGGHGSSSCDRTVGPAIKFAGWSLIVLIIWCSGVLDLLLEDNASPRAKNIFYAWVTLLIAGCLALIFIANVY